MGSTSASAEKARANSTAPRRRCGRCEKSFFAIRILALFRFTGVIRHDWTSEIHALHLFLRIII